jgi:SAM-dependent methyltransferase
VFAQSFGSEAARYADYRPSYPVAAIDHVIGDGTPRTILDLGAGTGKLTELMVGRGEHVIAVEPDAAMLDELARRVPQATALAGSAERIPVPDASVDLIVAGQAYHWFSHPESDREVARVLRRGGGVGLFWNYPDRTVDWIPKLYKASRDAEPPWAFDPEPLDTDLFTEPDRTTFESVHVLAGPKALVNLVHTWSWVITQPAEEQAAIDARLAALIAEYPVLQGETIAMPQQTVVLSSRRR